MSDKQPESAPPEAAAAAPAAAGGLKAWLPLLVTIVVMPALAFATTKFLILPKVLHARGTPAETEEAAGEEGHGEAKTEAKESKEHGEPKEEHGDKAEKHEKGKEGKEAKGKKQTAQLTKIIVNVSGSMGTRYLMSSITLVGSKSGFKETIEENKDQLLDLANTALASRTITDLEKPGSRNLIRSELISIFNNALGANAVQEIYFTEFAIQ